MKKVPLLLYICLMLWSCQKDNIENTCLVDNPAKDLSWLREKIKNLKKQKTSSLVISQASLNGETVFIFSRCGINITYAYPIYNCKGEIICLLGGDCPPGLSNNITQGKVIGEVKKWVCDSN